MATGNDKLQDRAGYNAPDKPNFVGFNGFFGARQAVPIDNDSGDIEIIPTPPPGWVRVLESFNDNVETPASIGQVAEIAPVVTGFAIWQDINGNETVLETVVSIAGILQATVSLQSDNRFLHLVNGERIIFRPAVPGAGSAVFQGSWIDTDLNAMRGDLSDVLQVVAQPPRGKTWALPPGPCKAIEVLQGPPVSASPSAIWRSLVFWNFDSIGHDVEIFLNDGSNDIPIDATISTAAWAPGPPYPQAGASWASDIEAAGGIVIPDGCSLKARLTEASAGGRCLLLAPFREINASKLANYPTF